MAFRLADASSMSQPRDTHTYIITPIDKTVRLIKIFLYKLKKKATKSLQRKEKQ